jgi:hypothetical protein
MQLGGKIIAAAFGLALAACASAPSASTVTPNPATASAASFAWGCWVAKDEPGGRIQGFLRLLKDGAEGKVYQGYLHDVRGSDMIPMLHLTIARDGTRATVIRSGEEIAFTPSVSTGNGLHFKSATPGQKGSLSISGSNDLLSLTIQLGDQISTFEGERDGCD